MELNPIEVEREWVGVAQGERNRNPLFLQVSIADDLGFLFPRSLFNASILLGVWRSEFGDLVVKLWWGALVGHSFPL
jgi:hypothetical protein